MTDPSGGRPPVSRVEFASEGVPLVGHLRLPAAGTAAPAGTAPAIVLTGPFTGVKEQVLGVYADRLSDAGFATLALDHRGFGESGGRRAHEDSAGKLADLRAAVGLLAAHPAVNARRIAAVGICLGGGYAMRAAAADPRIRAVAGIAGAYNSPAHFAAQMGIDGYRSALSTFLDRYDEELPAVAPDGGEAAMGGDEPFAYYGTARSASPYWENRVTRGSLHALMTFDALGAAPLLGATPLLVVHGRTDAYCAPELAEQLHTLASGTKEIHWLDTAQHIDLYDVEPYVDAAVATTVDFLHRHLPPVPSGQPAAG
ncbi:MAG TPA: alpha/beta hydrolase [Micromonosporaceae bacterium]|nr:alpha/beta hydrolase [Micromonosporaceae bacterium]